MKYKPQLDALRAIAILSVLCAHLAGVSPKISHLGVRLFFVLSGFLITDILANQRAGVLSFYVRRAARLWPLLYAALVASVLLNLDGARAAWAWHFAQLTNVKLFQVRSWDAFWPLIHLWTLNVEAQFYLVWPLLVAATPGRLLKPTLWAVVAVAPIYRYLTAFDEFAALLPPASLDALAAGGLLALQPSRRTVYGLAAIGAAGAALGLVAHLEQLFEFAAVFAFCGLVLAASEGRLTWLQHPWLANVGKISYGVYILHPIVWATMIKAGWPEPRGAVNLLAVSLLTLCVAAMSYRWFERPLRTYAARQSAKFLKPQLEKAAT